MQTPEVLNNVDVVRAIREEEYRETLSLEQKQAIQSMIDNGELSDELLEEVAGGTFTLICTNRCGNN